MISYIKSLIRSILQSLGLYQKQGTILFLGLDNAGKTTLLHKLRTNTLLTFSPTERPHYEEFYMDQIKFVGWDLGGHEAVRHIWGDYIDMMKDSISGIFFMIDACDFDRLEDVRDELDELINGDGGLKNGINDDDDNDDDDNDDDKKKSVVPLAILLNKCDLDDAYQSEVIQNEIGYHDLIRSYEMITRNNEDDDIERDEQRYNNNIIERERIRMFRVSVWKGEGYQEAFQWISTFL